MKTWTPPGEMAPEIDLLVRRWGLPRARAGDVQLLLAARADGGTAVELPAVAPAQPEAWGPAVATGTPPAPVPLVLRQFRARRYLQAWRFFAAEQAIARSLLARATQPAPAGTRSPSALLQELGANELNALQSRAVAVALSRALTLITGGPGTGKTHTLARLLALLIAATPERPPVIHLAAPTGKAADRMKEAVETAADRLPATLPAGTRERLKAAAAGAATIHGLLGFNPVTGRCRFHAGAPLRSDVVIVDECSMVDTLLWQALLAALPSTTRLVLLGDPNQLESVAAGDVLGSLVRFAGPAAGGFREVWVELTESRRFRHRPGIGALASAVVNRAADDAIDLLRRHPAADVTVAAASGLAWLGDHGARDLWTHLPAAVGAALQAIATAKTPSDALAALGGVRLLSAHRDLPLGVAGLNAEIQRRMNAATPAGARAPNLPIIVNHNDPETGLKNGSVGVVMENDGATAAYFPAATSGGAPLRIPLSRLIDYSPAWALTIHRSQGSEFDHVVVFLPPEESPLATRELIYTAITRAREQVYVWGGEATVRAALGERAQRCTLLEASLETEADALLRNS